MTLVPTLLARPAAVLALAAPAFAADLFVGPGHPYAEIQEAIDAAAHGDRIFVAPGTYPVFDLGKAVEIRGAGPGATRVTDFFTPGGHTRVTGIPAGAVATLASLGFEHGDPTLVLSNTPLLEVVGNAGSVVLRDVHANVLIFAQPSFAPALLATDTTRLLLAGCDVRGFQGSAFGGHGHPAIDATNVSLWIVDSTLLAGDASGGEFTSGAEGAPALRLVQGDLRLARVRATGGTGEYGVFSLEPFPGGPAVELEASTLVVTGGPANHLQGGKGTWDGTLSSSGGPALRLAAGSAAELAADATLQGGLDGLGTTAASPLAVEAGSSALSLGWNLPALAPAQPETALGAPLVLELSGEPGALVLPAFSPGLGPALELGGIAGVLHLDLTLWGTLPVLLLDGAGLGTLAGVAPTTPALAGGHVWFQTAELAGGAVRLSNPTRVGFAR